MRHETVQIAVVLSYILPVAICYALSRAALRARDVATSPEIRVLPIDPWEVFRKNVLRRLFWVQILCLGYLFSTGARAIEEWRFNSYGTWKDGFGDSLVFGFADGMLFIVSGACALIVALACIPMAKATLPLTLISTGGAYLFTCIVEFARVDVFTPPFTCCYASYETATAPRYVALAISLYLFKTAWSRMAARSTVWLAPEIDE